MAYKNKTVGIYTLGCKVNQYESEAISEELERRGFSIVSPACVCDAYVINTCTVTAESDRKARQFIRRAIGKNANAAVVVTGCMAQISADEIAAIEGVDAVVGNADKMSCAEIIERLFANGKNEKTEIFITDIKSSPFEKMRIGHFDRTRAYVKIEDGCESRCTYCIIPDARGGIRSKPVEDVISEVTALTRGGCREIVLTGIETGSYGKDLGGIDLADLLCRIDKIEGIGRVRLGSLDPSLIKEDFVKRIAELESLAPHFHLSLQSGSNRILALMKRKYNARQAMAAIELLRKYIPNVKFTTDIIVGFPQESEENFGETVEFVKAAGFLTAHIFPYSKRKGTPAAIMQGQISKDEKSRRLHLLEAVEADVRRGILEAEIERGNVKDVLFETFSDGVAVGHTADFLEVHVPSSRPLHAEIYPIRFISTDGNVLFGEIA
ncbi:MAG: tRNA (N(6)-L-threonylcarbamoyladenosine(37)-C(2))-methylthiotransferase MtaB [Ruminococcaceae bacterium]|nr:tRNA (N(6)-L-threonylcarbamoyladenosine(37)-C(2))-methylthiotransferase MtaB [Oscillospiraceae bacterium]